MSNYLNIGHVTGPFGIKGEVKINSLSNHLDKIFVKGNVLHILDKTYIIKNARAHKNAYLVSFEGLDDISLIDDILKKDVYVTREEIHLNDDEYLNVELLEYTIYENDNKIGLVDELLFSKKDTYITSGKLIIPLIDKYFEKVDIKTKRIYVKNIKELRLWK